MSPAGSVTCWIQQLKAGDQAAIQKMWQGYFRRLVGLARARLRGIPRAAADEEDLALSSFDSFSRGAEEGRFPQLLDRDDLGQLLVLVTLRKAANLVQHERRQKRGGSQVRHASALADDSEGEGSAFAQLIGREPDSQFAAQVVEEYRRLLARLRHAELRFIAVWKMEGHSNKAIAAKLGRSLATVELKLKLIRGRWIRESTP
jgi:DNA-directed RNA polymerase specialized sigma24 family protein